MQLGAMFLFHLILAALNLYAMIALISCINGTALQQRLTGTVSEKFGGGVLIGFGVLFLVWAAAVLANALVRQIPLASVEIALRVADFLMTPAWIIGGVHLWQRKPLGYVSGLGLLFQASMLFIGLIALFGLRSLLFGAHFSLTGTLVVFAMGTLCFIPFCLFLRGVKRRGFFGVKS